MDWYFDSSDEQAFRALRDELLAYLTRHASDDADLFESQLIFEELVGNAVRHASGPVWVSVEWSGEHPVLTVHDLGRGFSLDDIQSPDLLSEGQRGLFLVSQVSRGLRTAHKKAGGTRVEAVLPLARRQEEDITPHPPNDASLPAPEEALPDGTFGKESFLRALVVELAQTLELQHGPRAAEAAVTRVGLGVGGRMEEEYRRARDITGRLTRDQMADLLVRLKHAIEGDFYVVEADDEKIVLENTRCPFGDIVKRAPALCRMTSSVFGGIAARNAGESAVQLEERIAVGDPQCRVTVWLTEPGRDEAANAQVYRAPA
ncbi:MAG TPA: methanogen output domain 1-containing protein [Actinomycetota bacterium]|nr:methanogen output domain 1-containing protein [Actinomycetota bacterium]